jgi:hypothetical protein|tara:strand:+ start:228 stop:659 length:432 start_codon:yes stop_codon:yes gene_type:complete
MVQWEWHASGYPCPYLIPQASLERTFVGPVVQKIRIVLFATILAVATKPVLFMLQPPPLGVTLSGIECALFYPWGFYVVPELLPVIVLLLATAPLSIDAMRGESADLTKQGSRGSAAKRVKNAAAASRAPHADFFDDAADMAV